MDFSTIAIYVLKWENYDDDGEWIKYKNGELNVRGVLQRFGKKGDPKYKQEGGEIITGLTATI